MKTDYAGIDYGFGKTNIDTENHIRFGVIPAREVGQAWYEDSEAYYTSIECPLCGQEVANDEETCPSCGDKAYKDINEIKELQEPSSYFYKDDKYTLEQADEVDIFVLKSPYYTYSQFCSPCAPGAGYLLNELETPNINNKTYCLGPEWFEDEKAPYTVWEIETSKKVN